MNSFFGNLKLRNDIDNIFSYSIFYVCTYIYTYTHTHKLIAYKVSYNQWLSLFQIPHDITKQLSTGCLQWESLILSYRVSAMERPDLGDILKIDFFRR
jgi:hypothetical protein